MSSGHPNHITCHRFLAAFSRLPLFVQHCLLSICHVFLCHLSRREIFVSFLVKSIVWSISFLTSIWRSLISAKSVIEVCPRILLATILIVLMKLRLGLVSLISLPLWRGVFGTQIPLINGVVGGVSVPSKIRVQHELLKSVVTTPGKLRVVENSGICGSFAPSLFVPLYISF